jgi:galactokinase
MASGTTSVKAETASTQFNLRVAECRLAAAMLCVAAGLDEKRLPLPLTLRSAALACAHATSSNEPSPLFEDRDLEALVAPALSLLSSACPRESYSVDEVTALFPTSHRLILFRSADAAPSDATALVQPNARLQPRLRAKHVFSEAIRVAEFMAVARAYQAPAMPHDTSAAAPNFPLLVHLGSILNSSHTSCDSLYDCSSPELNELTALCRASPGCFGARLTGAGWGGNAVALVSTPAVDSFVAVLQKEYYAPRGLDAARSVFTTSPARGACVFC